MTREGSSSSTTGASIRRVLNSIDVWLQNASYGIVNHFLWKTLVVLFTGLLLLGRPCQFWFLPASASADAAINTLHLVGFSIFLVDMIFHSYLDVGYLPGFENTCKPDRKRRSSISNRQFVPYFYQGSFNFWYDLASTVCFLMEIPYIFPRRFGRSTITIELNILGFPNEGEFSKAVKADKLFGSYTVMILIFKTTRVARLIPPMKVVDLASKIKIHWYLVHLNPLFYCRRLQRRRRLNKEAVLKRDIARRATGGGLLVATVATIQAMKKREEKIKQKGKLVYSMYLVKKWAEYALRVVHILPNTSVELNRQIAATRIQRAWRNRSEFQPYAHSDEGSHAWTSTRDGMSSSMDFIDVFSRRSRVDTNHNSSIHRRNSTPLTPPVTHSDNTAHRKLKRRRAKRKKPSQVGTAMAELTGQVVTLFLFANLLIALLFTYYQKDTTDASTMVVLHGQTTKGNIGFAKKAVDTARRSTIPNLYSYTLKSKSSPDGDYVLNLSYEDLSEKDLREYEIRSVTVCNEFGESIGLFNIRKDVDELAMMELFFLAFVLLSWFWGVAAFAAPIMALVIVPIERAVKLLSMLVMDPLGYRNTLQYKNFLTEADKIASKNGRWTREVLKGMETEFLMSTIVRIGSLMKVGFGSAGVKIIRNNLEKIDGEDTGALLLNSQGSMVSCIFLFCDIRSFTDATECLQEEVFVFTNQIAAVVHSICSSYGGSANKNIGDAFLISWKLDASSYSDPRRSRKGTATSFQADKALFSVVKICMALHHNDYYVEMLSEYATEKLLNKLKDRPGPTVQLGFGLHAGKAVEGAIGSQRKIDATYVSMAVERAEYLESSTKKYKVPMLMSNSFHRLLQPRRRKRCRKIDRIMFENENDELRGKIMDIFTYDVDIDALWNDPESLSDSEESSGILAGEISPKHRMSEPRLTSPPGLDETKPFRSYQSPPVASVGSFRRGSFRAGMSFRGGEIAAAITAAAAKAMGTRPPVFGEANHEEEWKEEKPVLVLPTGRAFYSENLWLQSDIRRIRRRYTTQIFEKFNVGLQKYYEQEWDVARTHFESILESFDDGPSEYYLGQMRKHNWEPPPDFQPHGKA